jgi:hypothetical protein
MKRRKKIMSSKRKLSNSRYNDAYQNKDKGGSKRKSALNWGKLLENRDVKFFEPREGTNKINIIPFEIKSEMNPEVKSGKMKVGKIDFMLDIFVHRYVGPDGADILCPKKNYGKACPLCEEESKYYEKGDKPSASNIRAKRRALLNVQPLIRGEFEPIQIWDVSHWLFMKELMEEAHACGNGEDIIPFADPEKGKLIKFRMTLEDFGDNKSPKFKAFEFFEREEEIEDETIDKAISFDTGLILLSYEEIEKIMYGQEEDESEKAEEPEKEDPKKEETKEPVKEETTKSEEAIKDEVPGVNEKEPEKEETGDGKCSHGHKWGEADNHSECKKCTKWDDCVEKR